MKELEGQIVIHAPNAGAYQMITPELPNELLEKFGQVAVQYDSDEDRLLWLISAWQIGPFVSLMSLELPKMKIIISNDEA